MSKIEAYKAAKVTAKNATTYFRLAIGLHPETGHPDTLNDKHELSLSRAFSADEKPAHFGLTIHSKYGYRGNSSCYKAIDGNLVDYFVRAANMHMKTIALQAIALANADAEAARRTAEDEAREVLGETTPLA